MSLSREKFLEYTEYEIKNRGYHIDVDGVNRIVDLAEFFGQESYIPVVNILTRNWQSINKRIEAYSEEEWVKAKKIGQYYDLSPASVALLLEVLEGEDTDEQEAQSQPQFTEAELKAFRKRVAKEGL